MEREVIHIINSPKEKAILIIHGSHELRRYPRENFTKNADLINIFYEDIKDMQERGMLVLFE